MNERQREWLDILRAHARSLGGACLSRTYSNSREKMRWRCAEGHEWYVNATSIQQGTWCRLCSHVDNAAGTKARTFTRAQAIARERGGLCLSTEYVNAATHLRWRCAEGHEWHATATSIRLGTWCPGCAHAANAASKRARMFAHVQAIARAKGGLCLSTEYVNSHTHLRWRCAEGHEWEARPTNISMGSWCLRCVGRARTIEDMQELARARGGRCLSRSYKGERSPLRWRCAEGHEWEVSPSSVQRGHWCRRCVWAALQKTTITDVQAMAAERGGVCLSTTISSTRDRLRFRCRVGHEFVSTAKRLRAGQWCSRCVQVPRGTLERLRRAAQRRGGVLLDAEYHGTQAPVRVRCRAGHEWSVTAHSLINGRWCRECWIETSRGRPVRRLSIFDMEETAASRGGRCLSDTYVNTQTKLRWQCHDGHEWDARPASIRSGHWCPVCAHRYRGTIDGIRALAAERGGKCRSRVYQNHNDVLRFSCARGHEFTATGMAVKSGAWCPACGDWDAPAAKHPRRRGRTPPS